MDLQAPLCHSLVKQGKRGAYQSQKSRFSMEQERRREIGKTGEKQAALHLRKMGYRIVGTNVRIGRDEIDIIAHDPIDDVLVFCEVKARTHLLSGYLPELNMTQKKYENILRSSRQYVVREQWTGGYRIDVVFVASGKVLDHIVDVALSG